MGHIVESEPKAQMGLGITVPYNLVSGWCDSFLFKQNKIQVKKVLEIKKKKRKKLSKYNWYKIV